MDGNSYIMNYYPKKHINLPSICLVHPLKSIGSIFFWVIRHVFREAQEMGKKHSAELNVKVVDYPNMVYVAGIGTEQSKQMNRWNPVNKKHKGIVQKNIKGWIFMKNMNFCEQSQIRI